MVHRLFFDTLILGKLVHTYDLLLSTAHFKSQFGHQLLGLIFFVVFLIPDILGWYLR